MKVCSRCEKEKDESEYHKNKKSKDGLQCICKLCMKNYNLEYYEKNKEVIKKRNNNIYRKIKENK